MENLILLLGLLEWVPMVVFPWIPPVTAIAAVIISLWLLSKHWADAYHRVLRTLFASITIGGVVLTVVSTLIGLYILCQPFRPVENNRWLEGAQSLDIPDASGKLDSIQGPVAGVVNPIVDRYNQLLDSYAQTTEATEGFTNLSFGFMRSAEHAVPYLLHALAGLAIAVVLGVVYILATLGKKRHEQRMLAAQRAEDAKERARLERELIHAQHEIDRTSAETVYLDNKLQWLIGVLESGHTMQTGHPFDENYSYVENGYQNYPSQVRRSDPPRR